MDLNRLGDPRRIAILRALNLGDMLCAIPALRALRKALPDAELVLVGLPGTSEFAARYRYLLDGFEPLPGYPGLPEQECDPRGVADFIGRMNANRFGLAIQMHGNGIITNPLLSLFGARGTAGFYVEHGYRPNAELFMRYPSSGPEVLRNLALARFLGAESSTTELEFPLVYQDRADLLSHPETRSLPSSYACVHPGGRTASRRWPAERFAAVADRLVESGIGVVLTGTAKEARLTAEVADHMRHQAIDTAGATGLGAMAQLLADSMVLVTNDTGISHLADALRVPSVVIFEASQVDRWAPIDQELHRRAIGEAIGDVDISEVIEQTENLLDAHWRSDRRQYVMPPAAAS